MALVDGSLEGSDAAAIEAHVAGCIGCQEEIRWLRSMTGDLESLGDSFAAKAPTVDVVQSVMAEVARMKDAAPVNVVTLDAKRVRSFRWMKRLAIPAVAAAVLIVLWSSGYRITRLSPSDADMLAGVADTGTQSDDANAVSPIDGVTAPPAVSVLDLGDSNSSTDPSSGEAGTNTATVELDGLTTTQVLATLKNGFKNPETRAQLIEWATLSEDKARALLESLDTSPEAAIGAANALLSGEDVERALLEAIKNNPDDPYLRYALAKALGDPERAAAELEALALLDPENSMARFELAANYLGQGDVTQATAALEQAMALSSASAYTRDAMTYNERALIESGMDPDVAHALTALTAGSTQYNEIMDLSNDLLEYGRYYQEIGEYDLAQRIFDSVREFGGQVVAGSSFSYEQMAGLEVQTNAIDMLSQIVEYIQVPGNATALVQQTQTIVNAFYALGGVIGTLSDFLRNIDPSLLSLLSDLILHNGDLDIQSLLQALGIHL